MGIEGLLAGRQSGESQQSFERWLATRDNASRLEKANPSDTADS